MKIEVIRNKASRGETKLDLVLTKLSQILLHRERARRLIPFPSVSPFEVLDSPKTMASVERETAIRHFLTLHIDPAVLSNQRVTSCGDRPNTGLTILI